LVSAAFLLALLNVIFVFSTKVVPNVQKIKLLSKQIQALLSQSLFTILMASGPKFPSPALMNEEGQNLQRDSLTAMYLIAFDWLPHPSAVCNTKLL
jgi:hypothetical protein